MILKAVQLARFQYCSDKLNILTLAPLTPQFWGEIAQNFVFLPPELGGWGAECKKYRLSEQYWARFTNFQRSCLDDTESASPAQPFAKSSIAASPARLESAYRLADKF
jgi:hypothetical protein